MLSDLCFLQEKRSELEAHAHHFKDELRSSESRRMQAEAALDRLKLEVRSFSRRAH